MIWAVELLGFSMLESYENKCGGGIYNYVEG